MSFRLRIFLLVLLTAVTAIGATAFLTLKLTTREVSAAREASTQHQAEIVGTITRFGLSRGRWPGLDRVAEDLSRRTHLHIRLRTVDGETLVDTDTLANRAPGTVEPLPVTVDPRPPLDPSIARLVQQTYPQGVRSPDPIIAKYGLLRVPYVPVDLYGPAPVGGPAGTPVSLVLRQLAQYRAALATIRCVTEQNGAYEPVLPRATAPYLTAAMIRQYPRCVAQGNRKVLGDQAWLEDAWKGITACVSVRRPDTGPCLNSAFLEAVTSTSAIQLQVFLGAPGGGADIGQLGRPALIGAIGLVLVALVGTAWIARRVSRPVRRLTEASQLLATGHHDVRVPAVGDGELARLSASFNAMAEAVQRSEERQRRLVADVAHEMRTPLSNLRGYLEGLADGVVEPNRELFVSLHEETLLQRRILDDLQVLVEAEAGELTYDRRLIDLAELATGGVTAHRAVAYTAHVALHVEAPGPVWVTADADRLRQVLGNLLTNAIRYTDSDGHILVRVRAEGTSAVLSVQDTGVGIAPADLTRVFDRFWRADPARQRATGGSGLGLTIAQRIAADHGGRIDVTSQPGAGTTFTVTLPLCPDPRPGPLPPTGQFPPAGPLPPAGQLPTAGQLPPISAGPPP